MTEHQIQLQLQEHINIYNRLQKVCAFWLEENHSQVRVESPLAPFSRAIYYCFLTYRLDLETFIKHAINNEQPDEIFNIYKGRKGIRIFLDIINMFEAEVNELVNQCEVLRSKLEEKVNPLLESIEKNWKEKKEEIKIKNGISKSELIQVIKSKMFESSFRRRAIYNLEWITHEEFEFLEFAWFLRNCMHNDFSSLQDKKFKYIDEKTNEVFDINLEKGKIIFLHARLVYSMSVKIATILNRILEKAFEV